MGCVSSDSFFSVKLLGGYILFFLSQLKEHKLWHQCVINAGKIGAREMVQCVKRFVEQA